MKIKGSIYHALGCWSVELVFELCLHLVCLHFALLTTCRLSWRLAARYSHCPSVVLTSFDIALHEEFHTLSVAHPEVLTHPFYQLPLSDYVERVAIVMCVSL